MKKIIKTKPPDEPGVYLFKKNKEILYIGKATSLRDRVRSYMSKGIFDMRGPLIEKMVQEADKIKWEITDTVLEAIILESNLIKKHQPKYNTKEKDDKSFNYVCITGPARNAFSIADAGGEKLPKVVLVRGKELQKKICKKIYGPYTSGSQLREALKIVRRIFPFLDDKSKNYLEFYKQINLAPDLNDRKLYLQNIKNINLFFQGKKKEIFRNLKKEMNAYSKTREFEKAAEIKRQLFALKHINDIALIKHPYPASPLLRGRSGGGRIEAYDVAHLGGKNMVGVMTVVESGLPAQAGEVQKSEYKKFKIRTQADAPARRGGNDTGALREILERRLAHTEWVYPNLIVVDGGVAQMNVARAVVHKMNLDIKLVSVVKDEKHKPKGIMGDEEIVRKYKTDILLANSEAHRFAIAYHKKMRNKNFLTQ